MNEAGVYFTHIVGGGEETEQLGGDLPIGTHHSWKQLLLLTDLLGFFVFFNSSFLHMKFRE